MEIYYELLSPERTASETLEEEPVLFWLAGVPVTSEPTTIEMTWAPDEAAETDEPSEPDEPDEGAEGDDAPTFPEPERATRVALTLTLDDAALDVLKEQWDALDAPTASPTAGEPGTWTATFEARPALLESEAVFLERMESPAEVLVHENDEGDSPFLELEGYRLTDIRR